MSSGASVTTTGGGSGGTLTLSGTAGTGASADDDGIHIDIGTLSTNGGAMLLNGVAHDAAQGEGITLLNTTTINSTTGLITLNGTGGVTAIGITTSGGANTIGSAGDSGNITFNTDSIALANLSVDTQNNITVKPLTPGTDINLGVGAANTGLQLDNTELATLHADVDGGYSGKLVIGDAAAGTGAVALGVWNLNGRTADVEVHGGSIAYSGDITWNTGINLLFDARTSDQSLTNNFLKIRYRRFHPHPESRW